MQSEIQEQLIIKALAYIIAILVTILGIFFKFILTKVSKAFEEQKETNKHLALISQALGYQKEKLTKHDFQINALGDRLNAAINRITMILAKKEETHV
jgi:uncharacterized protein YoxC